MVNKILNHENISNKDQTTLVSIWYKFLIKYLIENAVNSVNGLTGDVILNADNVLTPEQVEAVNSTITLEKLSNINNDITNINERIEELANKGLTFTGFVSNTEPLSSEYEIQKGNLWINATEMPLSFPVSSTQIKIWDGSKWSSSSEDYTPKDFEFFRNINDNEGYYWFGGQWKVMSTDMSTDYFKLNPTTGKWEIKDEVSITVSTPEKDDNSKKAVNSEWVKSITDEITNNIDTINNVNVGKLSANTEMIADNTEQELTPWIKTLSEKVNGVISTSSFDTKITNCLTKIPNDIKLELNDGNLTLKAGSKVYVPNGEGVFDEVVIDSDIVLTDNFWSGNDDVLLFYRNSSLIVMALNRCSSGSSAPSSPLKFDLWYDITNNVVKRYNGTSWDEGYSLPLAKIHANNNQITSIDQVFNGFGYIGSTIFALPGVEGLIPDGRNEDGSLKNKELIINKVITETYTGDTSDVHFLIDTSITLVGGGEYNYDFKTNLNKQKNKIKNGCDCGVYNIVSEKIVDFKPKLTFQAVDRNDTEWASTQGKPSSRHENLELQASGTQYTAQANGWVYIRKQGNAVGQFAEILTSNIGMISYVGTLDGVAEVYAPVSINEKFTVNYTTAGATILFRFIYDEGSN